MAVETPSWVELIFLQGCIYIPLRPKGDYTFPLKISYGLSMFFSPETRTVKDLEVQECWAFVFWFSSSPFCTGPISNGQGMYFSIVQSRGAKGR